MKVSIITVCFNSVATIRDTIVSVLSQDYQDIEYIVVDGASTDGTMEIVNEYAGYVSTVITEPDTGIYDAINKGICAATGDIIGILNSDDVFLDSNTVSDFVALFDADTDGVYADLIVVDREHAQKKRRFFSSERFSFWKMRFGIMFPHPTFYVRRSCYEKWGLYKTDYRVSADFELVLRFMLQGIRLKRLPKVVIRMREGGASSNGFLSRVRQNSENVRACRENGLYTNLLFMALKVPSKLASYIR